MKMTLEQKDLVVQNLNLVNEVIYYRIKRDPGNPDHDMEDLEQIGRERYIAELEETKETDERD